MPLNIPIQAVIDRRLGDKIFFGLVQPVPKKDGSGIDELLLDEVGGSNSGHLPGDPPPVRCTIPLATVPRPGRR